MANHVRQKTSLIRGNSQFHSQHHGGLKERGLLYKAAPWQLLAWPLGGSGHSLQTCFNFFLACVSQGARRCAWRVGSRSLAWAQPRPGS